MGGELHWARIHGYSGSSGEFSVGPPGEGVRSAAGSWKPLLTTLVTGVIAFLTFCILIYFSLPGGSPVVVKPNVNEGNAKVVPAGEVLEGFVMDAVTGSPISEAALTIVDLDDLQGKTPQCRTNPSGRFRFRDLPPSTQSPRPVRLRVQKSGYEPSDSYVTLGTTALPITLQPTTSPENDR